MEPVDQKIYTTGYTGRKVTDLPALLDRLDAVLVDIRFSPKSHQIVWTLDYLSLLLKKRYFHIPDLGTRQFREGVPEQIQNLRLGLKVVRSLGVNVVMMCACADIQSCHRLQISAELGRQGLAPQEIDDWRFLSFNDC